jgi:hypothetical protein
MGRWSNRECPLCGGRRLQKDMIPVTMPNNPRAKFFICKSCARRIKDGDTVTVGAFH